MAGVEQLLSRLASQQNIMLDTNTVIYFLDGTPGLTDLTLPVFEMVENGKLKATISTITEAELLVKPYREKNTAAIEAVAFFLAEFPNLKISPISREISRQAAKIRAESGLRLPDAMILATAVNYDCDLLVGNDINLMKKADSYISTILLNDYV